MRLRWLALLAVLLVVPQTAAAVTTTCGDARELEMQAYKGRLGDEVKRCLEASLEEADPQTRAAHSFVLIVDAYISRDMGRYGELMERHLTRYHTTDAEVAYLYANWLRREQGASDEVIHWARVALDGRRRWLANRANYNRMVRALYDMLVEVSMERALQVQREVGDLPGLEAQRRLEGYRRQAKYWLIIAAPCLHKGECGPYYEVEIEGWAPCNDLVAMDTHAKRGQLGDEHWTCLKESYRKPAAPKRRILDVMATQADTTPDGSQWDELLAWHWRITGDEDPELAFRYAAFLAKNPQVQADADEVMKWSGVALDARHQLRGRSGRAALTQLLSLRVETARRMVEHAHALGDPEAVQLAQQRLTEEQAAYEAHCAASGECD